MNRRVFLAVAAGAATMAEAQEVPDAIKKLRPMLDGVHPITDDERRARIEKAQRLMRENKIDAIVLEPGSSMFYFIGAWRDNPIKSPIFTLVIPVEGTMKGVMSKASDLKMS